jgi:hypothetical protein
MRHIHASDYTMLLALLMQITFAGLGQTYLNDIYLMTRVQNGIVTPGADFLDRMQRGLRADGIMLVIAIVGIWVIKMNFLLFFWQLGNKITFYRVFWGVAVVVVVGCGAAVVGVLPFDCVFGSIMHIVTECSTEASVAAIYTKYKVTVGLDCLSDALSKCCLLPLRRRGCMWVESWALTRR